MLVELHNIYRLANGMFVIAVEDRGTYMLTTKIGEVPGFHHRYDGSSVFQEPGVEDEFRIVAKINMTVGSVATEESF